MLGNFQLKYLFMKKAHIQKATPDTCRDRKQKDGPMQDDLSAYVSDEKRLLYFQLAVATKQKIPHGVANFVGEGRWESSLLWFVRRYNVGLSAK